jgi:hypothetical protein
LGAVDRSEPSQDIRSTKGAPDATDHAESLVRHAGRGKLDLATLRAAAEGKG